MMAGDGIFAMFVAAVPGTPKPVGLKEHLMAEKLTWDDAEKIGVLLARKHPELYPLSTDLEELRRRVTDLAEFKDDFDRLAIRINWKRFERLGTRSSLIARNSAVVAYSNCG